MHNVFIQTVQTSDHLINAAKQAVYSSTYNIQQNDILQHIYCNAIHEYENSQCEQTVTPIFAKMAQQSTNQ